jgi:hypothetical protein
MTDALAGFNCVNLFLQINRSSVTVVRQGHDLFFTKCPVFQRVECKCFHFTREWHRNCQYCQAAPELPRVGGIKGGKNNAMGKGTKNKNNGIEIRTDGRCRALGNRSHGV